MNYTFQNDSSPKQRKESPKFSSSYFLDIICRFLQVGAVRRDTYPEPELNMNTVNPSCKIIYALQSTLVNLRANINSVLAVN